MNDDDVTQFLLIPTQGPAKTDTSRGARVQPAHGIGAPTTGSRSAGETYYGDTDPGVPGAKSPAAQLRAAPQRPQAARGSRGVRPTGKEAQTWGLRRAVALAALAGIALALGLSLSAQGRVASSTQPTSTPAQASGVPVASIPASPVLPRAPEIQIFAFEMSPDEAAWARLAHVAAERGDCPQGLELYQRLVNLTVETKESRVLGTSRWLPFLEQVRRRCLSDHELTSNSPGAPRP